MYGDYQTLVQKLVESSGYERELVEKKIRDKQAELSGMISAEGAAHIVAREMGVQLLQRAPAKKLEIKNIVAGMRNVTFEGRVVFVSGVREFSKKDGSKGKVSNVTLADRTGSIRISLWNEEADSFNFQIGDVLALKAGYVVEDNRGNAEARVGKGRLVPSHSSDLPPLEELKQEAKNNLPSSIESLIEGGNASFRAAVLQLFESDPFYATCPQCNLSLSEDGKCKDHGDVVPNFNIVLSGILDDGTGNIRAVLFRDAAEKLLGMKTKEALEIADRMRDRSMPVKRASAQILGKEFVFSGRARRNKMFNRLEFIVNDVSEVNAAEETKNILQSFSGI